MSATITEKMLVDAVCQEYLTTGKDLAVPTIAELLGCSESTVYKLLRARSARTRR